MKIKAYLSRRANGLYLLTYWPPIVSRVGVTQRKDVYASPGDPLAVNNLCEWSAEHLWGVKDLQLLQSVRVIFDGEVVQEQECNSQPVH